MTLEELEAEWRANPSLAESVRADMAKPHWKVFLQLLGAASYAKTAYATTANVITGNGDALAGKVFGYEACLANIDRYSSPPRPVQLNRLETYGVTDKTPLTD